MTDAEQIKRITKLLNDLNLRTMTREELASEMMNDCTFKDIEYAMWFLYCFASDVRDTLNM